MENDAHDRVTGQYSIKCATFRIIDDLKSFLFHPYYKSTSRLRQHSHFGFPGVSYGL